MMLCTQQVGLVHVYASLCLQNKNKTNTHGNKQEVLFCSDKSDLTQMPLTEDNKSEY